MQKKDDLIRENMLLKKKLALAEAWMRREVAHQRRSLGEDAMIKSGRKKLDNVLERESIDIITRRIESYFWENLLRAPKYTLEHLIDAEIYWQTLQKFPTLDALPVVSSYQKILDAFFENLLIDFRKSSRISLQYISVQGSLDRDIQNVLEKKYTLSLGRWFHFFQKVREGNEFGWKYEDLFLAYITKEHESLLEICINDPFFSGFSELILLEVFGRKRHDTKISYADARRVREICDWSMGNKSILKSLF